MRFRSWMGIGTKALKGMGKHFQVLGCERAWRRFGAHRIYPNRPNYDDFCKMYLMGGEL